MKNKKYGFTDIMIPFIVIFLVFGGTFYYLLFVQPKITKIEKGIVEQINDNILSNKLIKIQLKELELPEFGIKVKLVYDDDFITISDFYSGKTIFKSLCGSDKKETNIKINDDLFIECENHLVKIIKSPKF